MTDPRVDVFLCFDANLAKLEQCGSDCEGKENILCVHRFEPRVRILRINNSKFRGWSDPRVLTYFLGEIMIGIAEKRFDPRGSVFIILTKDRNFIGDVKRGAAAIPNLTFSSNSISCGGITILIKQVNCPNYGSKRADDLRCIFKIVNNFNRDSV